MPPQYAMDPRDRLILALDVKSLDAAMRLVEATSAYVGAFKVGIELVNVEGPRVFSALRDCGAQRIFYDAKFHDIPNTVFRAVEAALRHHLWMLNVHASGGSRMVAAAAEAIRGHVRDALTDARPILLGVTLLTSLDDAELHDELMVRLDRLNYVRHLAQMVQRSGGQGVVASAWEIEAVRDACGEDFVIVTPGVRPEGFDAADQRRTATPAEALKRGADYLVVGRPITAAKNPTEAARRLIAQIPAE
ncbi:MAG: orotidine-5'-phosphate decarboxylase [Chthonomonadales bacterium]